MQPGTIRKRAIAGAIGPLAFITSWVVAGALRSGYDPMSDAISRLAELGAENRWIVSTGMVTFGGACLAFAPCLRHPASISLRVAGAASLGVAAFPCTEGCPGPGTVTDVGHTIAAGVHYVAFVLTPVLHERRPVDVAVAALAGAALLAHGTGIEPNGALQRAGLTILDAWLFATAFRTIRRHRQGRAKP